MAHPEQHEFVKEVRGMFPDHFRTGNVLEIGSRDVNGSVRQFFSPGARYVGIDCTPGPCVDEVCLAHEYRAPKGLLFDTVISCEAFEHDPYFKQTIQNVMRCLRVGGLFVATWASPLRGEHGTRRANNPEGTFGPDPDHYRGIGAEEFLEVVDPYLRPVVCRRERLGLDCYAYGIRVVLPRQSGPSSKTRPPTHRG